MKKKVLVLKQKKRNKVKKQRGKATYYELKSIEMTLCEMFPYLHLEGKADIVSPNKHYLCNYMYHTQQ